MLDDHRHLVGGGIPQCRRWRHRGRNARRENAIRSIAAALVAVLLVRTDAATGLPPEQGFVTIFVAGAVTAGLAMVLIAVSRSGRRDAASAEATVDFRAMNNEWG
ncbi:MAG TPA: hypothetical protein VET27_26320 [Mycobacterium sp.]|nr:hypothetical protein [Mycobacterium sp.]